jgi:uncharacterized protein YbjQ (UPF0145 family)
MSDDFIPTGSPSGWYRHPNQPVDYFYTGRGFATVGGQHIRRRHVPDTPDFVSADESEAAAWVRLHGVDSYSDSIPNARIVTLQALPGYRIVEVLGVVTELTSASGWTASSKGNSALDRAKSGLVHTALGLGANAIVGLSTATFGAHGGLTSGLGGDAVGILLSGTAVRVLPLTADPS